jgi:hypothetical protein
VRKPLEHIEPCKERCGVKGRRDLTGATAGALDHLALEDLPGLLKAVGLGALTDHGVEAHELAGGQDEAIEFAGRHIDVLAATGLVASAREERLVFAEHGADIEGFDEGTGDSRGEERDGHTQGVATVGDERLQGLGGAVLVEIAPGLLGDDLSTIEVEPRRRGRRVEGLFDALEHQVQLLGVRTRRDGHADLALVRRPARATTLVPVARVTIGARTRKHRVLIDGDPQGPQRRLHQHLVALGHDAHLALAEALGLGGRHPANVVETADRRGANAQPLHESSVVRDLAIANGQGCGGHSDQEECGSETSGVHGDDSWNARGQYRSSRGSWGNLQQAAKGGKSGIVAR